MFYISIYLYFCVIYFANGYQKIPEIYPNSPLQQYFHRFFIFLILPLPWITLYIIKYSNPGIITSENYEKYEKRYPYDDILFKKGAISPIDSLPIIPRSKYCDIMNKRIAKYDHYCPWILSVVAEQTQKYFLLFIIFNIVNAAYFLLVNYNFCSQAPAE